MRVYDGYEIDDMSMICSTNQDQRERNIMSAHVNVRANAVRNASPDSC